MREAVVLVHGIWMNGLEFWRLRRNLERAGYECHIFKYHVWGKSLTETAGHLHEFAESLDGRIPDMRAVRDGLQAGAAQYALEKLTPQLARRSRCGVIVCGLRCKCPTQWFKSSMAMKSTFVFSFASKTASA